MAVRQATFFLRSLLQPGIDIDTSKICTTGKNTATSHQPSIRRGPLGSFAADRSHNLSHDLSDSLRHHPGFRRKSFCSCGTP